MCGILGGIAPAQAQVPAKELLGSLAHRGPDGEGSTTIGDVWFGHRRLAIIDLSETGAQPMSKAGCGTIIFNGEIYDHEEHRKDLERAGLRFDGRSDTEVLLRGLARSGPAFLRNVHGMYALAWLEPGGERLWLARDHAGMKPLYLWLGTGRIAFASEVRTLGRAMRANGGEPRLDGAAVAEFLRWGAVSEPRTILEGVEMIPADAAVCIDVRRREMVRHERTETIQLPNPDADPVIERVRRTVRRAVSRHLVADTSVALFLSGGIDSGVLAAEAAAVATKRPTAITVILGSRGTADEAGIARALTSRLGLELEVVSVADWMVRLGGCLEAYDQPSVDGLNTFLISGVARELGFKVALSGVGADEVFGGYQNMHRRASRLSRLPGRRLAAAVLAPLLARSASAPVRRLGALMEGAAAGEPMQRSWRRLFPESVIRSVFSKHAQQQQSPDHELDPLTLEQSTYLRNTLLRDTDVMGMARGVEIRAPYLDPELLGVVRGIGWEAVLDRRRPRKWILREGWGEALERGTLDRAKTGFTLDVASWLRGPGREFLAQARTTLADQRFLDRAAAMALFDRWEARLDQRHPAAWAPLFALAQVAEQIRRWGEPR
jgi:asparagine synthase (glutamine-hydrolysing)